jgi:pimeloyl-ACP methyl ester carboxylesterase
MSIAATTAVAACSSGSTAGAPSTTTRSRVRPTTVPGSTLGGDVAFLGPIATVPVGDVTMAFRQFGEGPDLLLICGQASSMSVWPATLLNTLAEHHRVTIYDNRDLGATVPTSASFTLPDLADDAAGLISALGLRRPAVFGWSTGGEIGLLLAVRHPDALSGLVVTGATPGGPRSVLPPPEIIDLFASANPDTGALLDVLFSPDGGAAQAAFIADYSKVPQPVLTPIAAAAYDAAERRYWKDPEPDLSAIRAPTLVMNGAGDYAVPPANAEYIARRIGGNARLELDPGGRHAWFIEHPDHFERALSTFLARARSR